VLVVALVWRGAAGIDGEMAGRHGTVGVSPLVLLAGRKRKGRDGGDVCEEEVQLEMPWSRDKGKAKGRFIW
jgi:hypothetical protein